jgi:shikimate dehydrogenase
LRCGFADAVFMTISGSTRVFMILGDPIVQVRAPEVFNHLFAQHGVDAVLVPAQVAAADLTDFVRHAFRSRNLDGLWVTVPHKAAIAGLLGHCDLSGSTAEAVNAVRRHADGSLEGALFDGLGFAKSLDFHGVPTAGARVLIVGAGGAGVAIATTLVQRPLAELALFDATPGRAEAVAERVRSITDVLVRTPASADPAGYDIVINATPLGLYPGDALPLDVARVDAGAVVMDILMTRAPTPLLRACRARGLSAHPGFEMMVQQAPDYLRFFGFHAMARHLEADLAPVRALMQPVEAASPAVATSMAPPLALMV